MATSLPPMDFGPYESKLGTSKKDKVICEGGTGFYTGGKNDTLINASIRVDTPEASGGFTTFPSVMSGGFGNDVYSFKDNDTSWGFIADGGGGSPNTKILVEGHFESRKQVGSSGPASP